MSIANALFSAFLGMVIFATYVYSGNVMSVSTTVLANMMIDRIKGPLNRVSGFYTKMVDF